MCRVKAALGQPVLRNAAGFGKRFGPTRPSGKCEFSLSDKKQDVSGPAEIKGGDALDVARAMKPLSVLHLNSMLTGGGTDDRSVRIAHALSKLGHKIWLAGPVGREFSQVAQQLGVSFHPLP